MMLLWLFGDVGKTVKKLTCSSAEVEAKDALPSFFSSPTAGKESLSGLFSAMFFISGLFLMIFLPKMALKCLVFLRAKRL